MTEIEIKCSLPHLSCLSTPELVSRLQDHSDPLVQLLLGKVKEEAENAAEEAAAYMQAAEEQENFLQDELVVCQTNISSMQAEIDKLHDELHELRLKLPEAA